MSAPGEDDFRRGDKIYYNFLSKSAGSQPELQELHDSWTEAASQGHIDAQNGLGNVYSSGIGVERDELMALEWFSKALHNIQQQTLRPDDRVVFKSDGTYGTVRRMFGNNFYEIMLADGQILAEPIHLDFLDKVPLPSEIKGGDRTFADVASSTQIS